MADAEGHRYELLGRYLSAACIGYQMGVKPETVFKKYRNLPVDRSWAELGEMLLRHMMENVEANLRASIGKADNVRRQ